MRSSPISLAAAAAAVLLSACAKPGSNDKATDSAADAQADSARLVIAPADFTMPEAVRYDPDQDVYFVGNWGPGDPATKDNNGYISRMSPDGKVEQLRFIAGGTGGATLHSPRGMTITGDTLWMADADAVRGFNRKTGAPLATVDFSRYKLGFLNDIAAGPDGALYLTDTGTDHVYRIAGGKSTVALHDSALGKPNGITWDAAGSRFIIVPWEGDSTIKSWTGKDKILTPIGKDGGTHFDGVEVLAGGGILVAAQSDSSLHLFSGGAGRRYVKTGGAPADIAVDTRRNRVAVPFVARNMVEIWQLPAQK